MDDYSYLRGVARDVLIEAEVAYECEYHGALFFMSGAVEGAYRLVNARVSQGKILLEGRSRRDFTDAIKYVYGQIPDFCGSCDNLMR